MKPNQSVIVIKFHDNDFYCTFCALLRSLSDNLEASSPFVVGDKERSVKVINDALYGFYRLAQNQYEYNDDTPEYCNHMKTYLRIVEDDLLLGEEAVKFANAQEWNNGETFILDMRLPIDQRVYSL